MSTICSPPRHHKKKNSGFLHNYVEYFMRIFPMLAEDCTVPMLFLIASFLPPTYVKRNIEGQLKRKKPTTEEIRQSFFLHVMVCTKVCLMKLDLVYYN